MSEKLRPQDSRALTLCIHGSQYAGENCKLYAAEKEALQALKAWASQPDDARSFGCGHDELLAAVRKLEELSQ